MDLANQNQLIHDANRRKMKGKNCDVGKKTQTKKSQTVKK